MGRPFTRGRLHLVILICGLFHILPVDAGPVAPVTKITTVLDLFNPISMVKFFEFSDRGWNISGECIRDMFWYLEAIEQDYLWPIKCKLLVFSEFKSVIS